MTIFKEKCKVPTVLKVSKPVHYMVKIGAKSSLFVRFAVRAEFLFRACFCGHGCLRYFILVVPPGTGFISSDNMFELFE